MTNETEKLIEEAQWYARRIGDYDGVPTELEDVLDGMVSAIRLSQSERDEALKQSAEWEVQAQDMRDRAVAAEKRLADLRGKVEGLTRWKADITTVGDVHLYMHSLGDVFKVSEVLAMLEDVTR